MSASRRPRPERTIKASAAGDSDRPTPRLFRLGDPIFVPVLVALCARLALAVGQPFANEDAYITFRYARNLAEGSALVYNSGERVMGFTSPLWTLWCSLGFVIQVDPVWWTRLTVVATDICAIVLASHLLSRHASSAAAWAFALFYGAWPLFAASAVSGLESNVVFFLMLAAARGIGSTHWLSGVTLGLLAISRPEGALAALILGLRAKPLARLTAAGMLAVCVAALVSYYGSAVPQSVLAKAAVYGLPGPRSGTFWWDWLLPFPMGRWTISSEGIHLIPLSMVFLASLVHGARTNFHRLSMPLALLCIAGGAILSAYALSGTAYFWWYLVVPLACLAMMAAAGFPSAIPRQPLRYIALAGVFGIWTLAYPLYQGRARAEYVNNASVAGVLRQVARPTDQVLLEPIGLVGYETRLSILDEVGLVTREVVQRRRTGPGWYADLVAAHRPEWIVVRDETLESPSGYAGVGAPFRSESERDGTFSHYALVWPTAPTIGIRVHVLRRRS